MSILFSLLLGVAQPAEPVRAQPLPPPDWSLLTPLPLLRRLPENPEISAFVRAEVTAGRCAAATRTAAGYTLHVDLAVLVAPDGTTRRIVPRAIDCPTVEQYASGLLSRHARGAIAAPRRSGDHWYRAGFTFAWPG